MTYSCKFCHVPTVLPDREVAIKHVRDTHPGALLDELVRTDVSYLDYIYDSFGLFFIFYGVDDS